MLWTYWLEVLFFLYRRDRIVLYQYIWPIFCSYFLNRNSNIRNVRYKIIIAFVDFVDRYLMLFSINLGKRETTWLFFTFFNKRLKMLSKRVNSIYSNHNIDVIFFHIKKQLRRHLDLIWNVETCGELHRCDRDMYAYSKQVTFRFVHVHDREGTQS